MGSKSRIILITGGQRSGKSEEAERTALSLSPNPVYIATAHIWDDDFRRRVEKHQQRRGPEWTTIEEEHVLSRHNVEERVVLIDCMTLWLTNLLFTESQNADNIDAGTVERVFATARDDFDRLVSQRNATFIVVTNEIGLGGVSSDHVQRLFTDLQGMMNRHVAARADEVRLMVSGIAVKIK